MLTITGIIKYAPSTSKKKSKAENLKQRRAEAANNNKCTSCVSRAPKPGFKQCEECITNGRERRARMLDKAKTS